MKILYIPLDYHRHRESPELFTDLVNALEGEIYQSSEQAVAYKPDIILFHGGLIPSDLKILKLLTGAPVIMWTGDCRYMPQESLMMYRDIVDIFLLPFDGEHKDRFSALLCKPCYFIWEPIQNWRFKQPQDLLEGPVSFIGNIYDNLPGGEDRLYTMEFIDERVKEMKIRGAFPGSEPVDNDIVPYIYNDAYIVIAENNMHDIQYYFTPRNIGGMAAGSCVVMRWFPGIEGFFEDGHNCFIYRHKYELLDIIQFLQKNPSVRNKVALNGYLEASNKFGVKNFANRVKEIIGEVRSSNS